MKKLFLFVVALALVSCSDEDTIVNIINGGSGTTVAKANDCSLIVNVGDADYGVTTRAVVPDEAVKSDSTLANVVVALQEANNSWTPYDSLTSTKPFINEGTKRGYVYAETNLTNPYADETNWEVTHSITNGSLTLTANKIGTSGYYHPSPVLFWGNYGLQCSDTTQTSYTEGTIWGHQSVVSTTKTAAIDHNIQYATSVFRPTFKVGSTITVYSDNTGKNTVNVPIDKFEFSIQYLYVYSSKQVVYGEQFGYTPSTELVPFKYALKENGIFGKVENGADVWSDWDKTNYANLSILPTNADSVRIFLTCYYMGDYDKVYVYNSSLKSYQKLQKGKVFYIYGWLKTTSITSVSNTGNALCSKTATGVFMADVKTSAEITISSLAPDKDGDGSNDPVVIDPSESDIVNYNGLFNVNVDYGNMNANWSFKK